MKELELHFEEEIEILNASSAKWKSHLNASKGSYSDIRHVQFAGQEQSDGQSMEQGGVANAGPQTPNADNEVPINTKNSQKDPDELKDSLTEVSESLEDPVTDLYKLSETSKDQQNLPSAKNDTLTLNKEKDAEPSITSTKNSVRRAEYEAAVAERKEQEEFERQEQEMELEMET